MRGSSSRTGRHAGRPVVVRVAEVAGEEHEARVGSEHGGVGGAGVEGLAHVAWGGGGEEEEEEG